MKTCIEMFVETCVYTLRSFRMVWDSWGEGWGMVVGWSGDGTGWYGIVMGRYGMVWDGMGWFEMVYHR